jgi:hypothetical protein
VSAEVIKATAQLPQQEHALSCLRQSSIARPKGEMV